MTTAAPVNAEQVAATTYGLAVVTPENVSAHRKAYGAIDKDLEQCAHFREALNSETEANFRHLELSQQGMKKAAALGQILVAEMRRRAGNDEALLRECAVFETFFATADENCDKHIAETRQLQEDYHASEVRVQEQLQKSRTRLHIMDAKIAEVEHPKAARL